jgi:2-aminoethylphosphonate dioxygenase
MNMANSFFSAAEIETFRQQGYLFVEDLQRDPEFSRLKSWVDELQAWPEVPGRYMKYFEESLLAPGERVLARVENFCPYHVGFNSVVNGPEMLGRVSELFGEPAATASRRTRTHRPAGRLTPVSSSP